jgi:hypothetical protein
MIAESLGGENPPATRWCSRRHGCRSKRWKGWRKSPNAKLIMLPGGPSNAFREAAAILKEM